MYATAKVNNTSKVVARLAVTIIAMADYGYLFGHLDYYIDNRIASADQEMGECCILGGTCFVISLDGVSKMVGITRVLVERGDVG